MIEILDSEWRMLHTIAKDSARRYPMVEADDVVQELAIWMIKHEDHILDWREQPSGYKARFVSLVRAARAYCEKEKAYYSGYKPEDMYFYSPAQIRKLLPLVFEDYQMPSRALDDEKVRGGDPSTGGNLIAEIADVREALKRISTTHRELLVKAAWSGFDYVLLGQQEGIPRERARSRVRRAVAAVQKELGGPDPHKEYTGQRKVMSNAQARAMIKNQEQ